MEINTVIQLSEVLHTGSDTAPEFVKTLTKHLEIAG